ncbi:MAG: phosphoglycerate mutase, partial [Candidatus Altiarchaeales archaeon]|nr:phosphoglycerate mutase [Candidatus Altiarchaeales archaeon]
GKLPKSPGDAGSETSRLLIDFTKKSREILEDHPVNVKRRRQGGLPGNCAWFWGPGHKPRLESFKDRYGLEGCLISAVDLLKGLAKYVGLKSIDVEGATGYIDTNYVGKAEAALKCLSASDFVYLHIESTDEAGHEGSIEHKVAALEDIDEKVLGTLLSGLSGEFRIAVLPDHATPIEVRSHVDDPVPYAVYDSTDGADHACCFTEKEIKEKGGLGLREGFDFMGFFLS